MTRMGSIVRLALGGLARTPLRVALTSLGVAIACGALISMVAFALGLQRQIEQPFERFDLLNNIQVKPDKDDESGDAPVLDDAAIGRLASLPGVVAAYPDFRLRGLEITHEGTTATGIGVGVPREVSMWGMMNEVLVAGRSFQPGDSPEVILGQQFVMELGFAKPQEAVGATVTLEAAGISPDDAQSFSWKKTELEVSIVGVYAPPAIGPRFMGRGILLPVDLMKEIPGIRYAARLDELRVGGDGVAQGYASAVVRVENPGNTGDVEQKIRAMGFQARSLLDRMKKMQSFFIFIDVVLACIGAVALIVAGLGIVNTLLMSVLERRREIGTYKAVGASDGDLVVLFLTEASMIGLAGGLAGMVLGRLVSWLLNIAVNVYTASQGVEEHVDVFDFPLWLMAGSVAFAIVVAVLSGVYPAVRAARVDPIRALRGE